MTFTISIDSPGVGRSEATFANRATVGREGSDVVLADPAVSRRHIELDLLDGQLFVRDLGSSHGTYVNTVRLTAEEPTPIGPGDRVFLGDTTLTCLSVELTLAAQRAVQTQTVLPTAPLVPDHGDRDAADELVEITTSVGVVRYRASGAPARTAPSVASELPKARRRLEALVKVAPGAAQLRPTICLVGPFPDPATPDRWITEGVVVDAPHHQLWMVVSDDVPPEPLERGLAVLLGSSLAAADDLTDLLEGYGTWAGSDRAALSATDERVAAESVVPLSEADGDQRAAMWCSFVAFLVEREGEPAFCNMMAAAQPSRIETALRSTYGVGAAELEELWRQNLATGAEGRPAVGAFAKIAWHYLRPYRARQIEVFAYMLAGLAFTLTLPFATRRLVDSALPSGKMSEVIKLLAVLALAFAVSIGASLRQTYVSAYISSAVVRDLRAQLFERLQRLPAGWYQRHQQGDVLSRMFNDVGQVERGLSQVLREGVFEGLSVVVSCVVLLILNPVLGVVGILGVPAIAIVYGRLARTAERRSTAVQEETASQLTISAENYDAERVVKVFGLAPREIARFATAGGRLFRAERKLALLIGMFSLSVNTIVIVIRLVIMGLGAYLVTQGSLSIGGLVAFLAVLGEMFQPVVAVTNVGQEIQSASGALVRVQELLDEPLEAERLDAPTTTIPRLQHEIRLEGVSFGYDTSRRVLDGVDVAIPAGARVAFVGPSGSGKSTILGLLMRTYEPDEGRITFDGVDIASAPLDTVRGQLGVVFQESFLFDTSIRENIALGVGGDAGQAEVEAAARAAEAHDFIAQSPRGYDTRVGERGSRLSGGQRQRVAIARALVRDPAVLLLDEATSALDPATERQINDTLDRAGSGRTTVAITHRLTSVVDYDQIYVIAAGKVVEAGTHRVLMAAQGLYAKLWAEQTGGAAGSSRVTGGTDDPAVDLDQLPFASELSPAERAHLWDASTVLEMKAGETLHEEPGQVAVLRSGRAEVCTTGPAGALTIVAELGSGDVFGLRSAYGRTGGSSLRAITPCSLLIVPLSISSEARQSPAFEPRSGRVLTGVTLSSRSLQPTPTESTAAVLRRTTQRLRVVGR